MSVALTSDALTQELHRIGDWWLNHAIDHENGGFHGEIANDGTPVKGAAKNVILSTRILWFFSEAYRASGREEYRAAATRAFTYLLERYHDVEHGGLIWEVDHTGNPAKFRKQIYAQGFGLYALSAYHRMSGDDVAFVIASELFDKIEQFGRDRQYGGYIEGFTRDWQPLDDMRLSEVDANSPKSMNTHLHVLEAYTSWYSVAREPRIAEAMRDLLNLFRQHIVAPDGHMRLFFSHEWRSLSREQSCGHDIEASWLLREAGQELGEVGQPAWLESLVEPMALYSLENGLYEGRQVINEIHADGTPDLTSPWWVQAEALVGYLSAFEKNRDERFLTTARNIWTFIQEQHCDFEYGEWLWDARQDPLSTHRDYKAGAWKGPYHNGRAMIEAAAIMRRIEQGEDAHHGAQLRAHASHD